MLIDSSANTLTSSYGKATPASICLIQEIAEKNDIMFLNYGDDIHFQKPEYFQDASHLNDTEVKEYSKEIARRLKVYKQP